MPLETQIKMEAISFLEFTKLMIPSATDALAKFWKCFRDIKSVRQAFKQFDADNDGAITIQEVIQDEGL